MSASNRERLRAWLRSVPYASGYVDDDLDLGRGAALLDEAEERGRASALSGERLDLALTALDRHEAYTKGREDERADIVTWLLGRYENVNDKRNWADAIRRGAHAAEAKAVRGEGP